MKKSDINKRPVIITSVSSTSWLVECFSGILQFSQGFGEDKKIVNPKPSTFLEGKFRCFVLENYYEREVDKHGNRVPYNEHCYMTYQEAIAIAKSKGNIRLVKETVTYYNAQTKEKTKDLKTAKNWFKGKNPVFIAKENRQQVGIWVEPGKDHVEIEFYVLNTCKPDAENKWEKVPDLGYWLYPDGTISHFFKGRLQYGQKREFVEERQIYRSLDARSELFTSLNNPVDLRREVINKREKDYYFLTKETLKILEKYGFPKRFWTWGDNYSRKLEKTWDLIQYAKTKQETSVSKEAATKGLQKVNSDFDARDLESLVKEHKGGLLIKVPGIVIVWADANGEDCPWPSDNKSTVKRIQIICQNQVWFKNDLSKVVCYKAIHFGKDVTSCNFESIDLDYNRLITSTGDYSDNRFSRIEAKSYKEMLTVCANAYYFILQEINKKLPILEHYRDLFPKDEIPKFYKFWSFLGLLYKAPKATEFVLRQKGVKALEDCPYHSDTMRYSLRKFLRPFGLDTDSYKECKRQSLFNALGVTREQFHFVLEEATNETKINNMYNAFAYLRDQDIAMPVKTGIPQFDKKKENQYKVGDIVSKRNFCYQAQKDIFDGISWAKLYYPKKGTKTDLTKIPLKYIKNIINFFECETSFNPCYYLKRISDFIALEDLATITNRNLSVQTLSDYFNMIQNVKRRQENFDDSAFLLIPDNAKHLRDLHREITGIYNVLTYEDRMAAAGNITESMASKYAKALEKLQEYAMESDDYAVVVPQNLVEIIKEGAVLNHCSATYVPKVNQGLTYFFFLRKKGELEKPLVTFNIVKDYREPEKWVIEQIHGKCDRSPTREEENIVRKWADLHGINMGTRY